MFQQPVRFDDVYMPILSPTDRVAYSGLLQTAFHHAGAFNGSEASLDALIAPLTQMENFIRARGAPATDAMETAFARAAGITDRAVTIADILEDASDRYYNSLTHQNSFDSTLSRLAQGGAAVIHTGTVLIPPGEGQIEEPLSETPHEFARVEQPRLSWLIEGLSKIGIYTDDILLHVSKVDPNMVRNKPYVVVEIPRLNKQIAVCDLKGEITFVSSEILDPALFEKCNKLLLKSLPQIKAVRFTTPDDWAQKINGLLTSDGVQKPAPKKDITAYAAKPPRRPFYYTEEMIIETAKAFHARTGQWPSQLSGLIEDAPLADGKRNWRSVDAALREGFNGLPGGSSLAQILAPFKEDASYTEEMIIKTAKAFHARTGEWPHQQSGLIEDAPLANGERTWRSVDSALRRKGNGLVEQSSLFQLLAPSKRAFPSRNEALYSNERIIETAKNYYKRTGEWPTAHTTGLIEDAPIADGNMKWPNLDSRIARRSNGQLSIAKLLSPFKNYTVEMIIETARAFNKRTGKWPSLGSGLIKDAPLADGKRTWRSVDTALRKGDNGLEAGSSLSQTLAPVKAETAAREKAAQTPASPAPIPKP